MLLNSSTPDGASPPASAIFSVINDDLDSALGVAPSELIQPPPPRRPEMPSSIPQTASPGPSCSSEVRFTCALPATLSGGIASPRRYPRSRSSRALCRCFTLSDLAPSWLARLSLLFGRGVSHPTCSLPLILSLEQHGDDEGE